MVPDHSKVSCFSYALTVDTDYASFPITQRMMQMRPSMLLSWTQILWLTAYKAAAAARVPWTSFHRFFTERYIQDYKHQLAKSELAEQPIQPQD